MIETALAAFAAAQAGASAIKGLADGVGSIRDLISGDDKASSELRKKLSAMLDDIISAKSFNLNTLQLVEHLKREVETVDRFNSAFQKYVLMKTPFGTLVYQLKQAPGSPEPEHIICPNCVEDRRISILQGAPHYKECLHCKSHFRIFQDNTSPTVNVRRKVL